VSYVNIFKSITQVYNNFANYQLSEYIKSKGKSMSSLTEDEKDLWRKLMIGELYPGNYLVRPLQVIMAGWDNLKLGWDNGTI
jgi:hypothetical protein